MGISKFNCIRINLYGTIFYKDSYYWLNVSKLVCYNSVLFQITNKFPKFEFFNTFFFSAQLTQILGEYVFFVISIFFSYNIWFLKLRLFSFHNIDNVIRNEILFFGRKLFPQDNIFMIIVVSLAKIQNSYFTKDFGLKNFCTFSTMYFFLVEGEYTKYLL